MKHIEQMKKTKPPQAVTDYLSAIGSAGGSAGKGDSKVRGNASYYAALATKSHEARAAKGKATS